MATIKQQSGDYDIVASGSLFTFQSKPLSIEFTDDPALTAALSRVEVENLNLQIHFLQDPEQDGVIKSEIITLNTIRISIYSTKILAGGTSSPLKIAENKKNTKKMFISISFQKISDSYLCHYTVFINK